MFHFYLLTETLHDDLGSLARCPDSAHWCYIGAILHNRRTNERYISATLSLEVYSRS